MMLKQTKCCNSHLCINHKDGGGRGKCKYLRNFASFLTHIFIANCTINKHRMRNINLKFLWYLDTLECNFCVEKIFWNHLWNRKNSSMFVQLIFLFFSFSRDSWHHSSSPYFIRHQTSNWSTDFGDWDTVQKKVCPGVNSSIRAYNNF